MLALELGINEKTLIAMERTEAESVLTEFESEMLERSATKVKHSAEAAQFLHSEIVLHEGDEPRGRCLTRKEGNSRYNTRQTDTAFKFNSTNQSKLLSFL
jgi:hypothetical protein